MNWDVVSAVAELLGAIGVIVSLLYLASQVRQGTKVARAATRQALAGDLQALAGDLVTLDDAARLFQRHLDGDVLEPHELLRLQARAYRDFRFYDNAFFQYREGMLSDEEWLGFRENLKLLLHVPVYRDYWNREFSLYAAAFQGEVSALMREDLSAPKGSLVFDTHEMPPPE